jgi:phage-related protein
MADKESVLAIVLRVVDQATAGINAFAKRISGIGTAFHVLTAPVRLFGEKLAGLANAAGLPQLVDGFKGVVGGLQGVGGAVKDLFGKLLLVGGIAGVAVLGLRSIVEEFATLGHTAARVGTTVDFLAAMRYAAGKTGASVEQLDEGLQTFGVNLGAARAGVGRMAKFLEASIPSLLTQLKATKNSEQAFRLLADAMSAVTDPAKRLKLAAATVGDPALAPLLARGSKGLLELQGSYAGLAGSQEEAAEGAGKVEEAMKDFGAVTDGIKAALITGLAPALNVIVDKLTVWFSGHREDVKAWAADIGEKLPKAVEKVTTWIGKAYDQVMGFVEAMGGFQTVALVVAAVIVGPLIASLVSLTASVITFGIALLTTPIGWILLGITALAVGVYELYKHWDGVKEFFGTLWGYVKSAFWTAVEFIKQVFLHLNPLALIIKHWDPIKGFFADLWDGVTSVFSKAWDIIKAIVDKVVGAVRAVKNAASSVIDFLNPFSDDSGSATPATGGTISQATLNAAAGAGRQSTEARVKVDFANAPRGTRVTADPQSSADVDLSVGYNMLPGAL